MEWNGMEPTQAICLKTGFEYMQGTACGIGMRSPDEAGDVFWKPSQAGLIEIRALPGRGQAAHAVSKNRIEQTNIPHLTRKLLFSLACNCNYSIEAFSTLLGTVYESQT
jgi:hypothetical protein